MDLKFNFQNQKSKLAEGCGLIFILSSDLLTSPLQTCCRDIDHRNILLTFNLTPFDLVENQRKMKDLKGFICNCHLKQKQHLQLQYIHRELILCHS